MPRADACQSLSTLGPSHDEGGEQHASRHSPTALSSGVPIEHNPGNALEMDALHSACDD